MASKRSHIDKINKYAWELVAKAPNEALESAGEALGLSEHAGYLKGEASARLTVGWCMLVHSDYAHASEEFAKSLDMFVAIRDAKGEMTSLNAIGVTYQSQCRYERAMDYYTQCIELARREKDREREAGTLNNIAEVCMDLGNLKEGLDYLLKAYDTIPDERNDELSAEILKNIAVAFLRMENLPIAREFAERALTVADKAELRLISANCWRVLGMVTRDSGRPELALSYIMKAYEGAYALSDRQLMVQSLLEIGAIRAERGSFQEALEDYKNALAHATEISNKISMKIANERMSDVYRKLGDHATALDCFRRFYVLEQEIQNEDTTRKLKDIQVRYEVEKTKQESEIYRLRNVELKDKTSMLEKANSQILMISDIGRRITSSLDLEEMLNSVYASLSKLLDTTTFSIGIYDAESESIDYRLILEKGVRLRNVRSREKGGLAMRAVETGEIVSIPDMDAETAADAPPPNRGGSAQSLLFVPLMLEKDVIGVLTLRSFVKNAYDIDKISIVKMISPYVAIALENSLIHDRLEDLNKIVTSEKRRLEDASRQIEHLANHDALTGLPNRRLLYELSHHILEISSRTNTIVGILYIDLDNFKPINDKFGHVVGDKALVALANRLKMLLRASDTISRVGGDEFVAVVNNVKDRSDLEKVAKKIIEECRAPLEVVPGNYRVSLSMGISLYPKDGSTIDDLIIKADSAMYRIKHADKNDYAFYGEA